MRKSVEIIVGEGPKYINVGVLVKVGVGKVGVNVLVQVGVIITVAEAEGAWAGIIGVGANNIV